MVEEIGVVVEFNFSVINDLLIYDVNFSRNELCFTENEWNIFFYFDRWGANGKDCLRKSICEIAGNPLQDEGLVGELLHVMLT